MKSLSLLGIVFLFMSCKKNLNAYEENASDFPIRIENVKITKQADNYYIEFQGEITNSTEHFLNELVIRPEIYFIKTTGDIGTVNLQEFSPLNIGNVFEKQTTLNFSEKIPFGEFNRDELRYEFDNVYLEMYLKGGNSTGYVVGGNWNNPDGSPAFYTIQHDITEEWYTLKN